MMRSFCLIILIAFSGLFYAQSIYYSSIENLEEDTLLKTEIGLFDLLTCQITPLYTDTTIWIPGSGVIGYYEWVDISLCPDGRMFGLGHDGIYEIDILNQSETKLFEPDNPPFRFWFKGLYCSKDTVLYFGERDVGAYDLNTSSLSYYGRMTTSTALFSNLFWFNNKLMGSGNSKVVDINLPDVVNSTIYCSLPISGLLSLVEVAISCDSIAVFAIYVGGDVYLLDQTDCSLSYYCTIPHNPQEGFQGITPNFMFMPPDPCQMYIDLDFADETALGIDYVDTFYCQLPGSFLLSLTDLFSDKAWDSLVVWLESGPTGLALSGIASISATLHGDSTSRLSFVSSDLADFSALSTELTSLSLVGDIPDGTTDLKIGFRGFADDLRSDTAYAYITLISRSTYAGRDTVVSLCKNDSELALLSLLSSEATPGGYWHPDDAIDPQVDMGGIYYYVVDDPICPADSADVHVTIYTEPIFDLGPDRLLCPGDTTVFSLSTADVDLMWSDGSSQSVIVVTEPGTVWVDVTDRYDCHYVDSTKVVFDESCLLEQLYIPNVFSPNGDGINDTWGIHPDAGFHEVEIQIFDRWGNNLFVNADGSLEWDGRSKNGLMVPSGVYVYLIKVKLASGSVFVRQGDVTLFR